MNDGGATRRRTTILTVAALAAGLLTGCSSEPVGGHHADCEGGEARVTGRSADGATWRTVLPDPTDQTPVIAEGHVLVQHDCGYAVLDLADGAVVRTAHDRWLLGLASGWVLVAHSTEDGTGEVEVEGTPLVGDEVDGYRHFVSGPHPGGTLLQVLDGRLVVGGDDQLSADAPLPDDQGWTTTFPALRRPTVTRVGDVYVVTSADGSIYGVDPLRGTIRWRTVVPDGTAPSYELTARARGDRADLVDVVVVGLDARRDRYLLSLRSGDGSVVARGSAAEESGDAPLHASGEGWMVRIDSDQVLRSVD